jgi:hypothetical protein
MLQSLCRLYLLSEKEGGVTHPTGLEDAPVIDPFHRPFALIYRPVNFS